MKPLLPFIRCLRKAGGAPFSGSVEGLLLPLFASRLSAGFPSPATDYLEPPLDLNQRLIRHPAATFFVHVEGESMIGAGIYPGDLLVVDRAETPAPNRVVVAVVNGEFTVKRLRRIKGQLALVAENPAWPPQPLGAGLEVEVWGVVTCAVHYLP